MSVGSLAAKIAAMEKAAPAITDGCFTAGLLHDVGKLLFVGNMPGPYAAVLQQAARQSIPLQQLEGQTFGVHHADLGALLLSSWGLPQPLVDAVGWHHEPASSPDTGFSLLTAVHVANGIHRELHSPRAPGGIDLAYLASIGLEPRCNHWRQACGCVIKR
jgi:HD-like signal output (HDOD) protein